ncbi:MAG: MBL fold metallo-hydrolase [Calditrichaeota bacterium]|nr:MBL fold metallo-hydrolase [Calditrichota bacterium]
MFDCGNGETLEQIFDNMAYWNLDPAQITACFLTHPHWDHAGAAHLLKEQGIKLISHPNTAKAVAAGGERCCGFLYHKTFTPCEVDEIIDNGESLVFENTKIAAIHLPGHTMGCTAYALDWEGQRLVFSGDVIGTLGYGDFGWDGSVDFDKKVYLQSLKKFARMDFDVMLPGHGLVSFYHPKRRVEDSLNAALIQWR